MCCVARSIPSGIVRGTEHPTFRMCVALRHTFIVARRCTVGGALCYTRIVSCCVLMTRATSTIRLNVFAARACRHTTECCFAQFHRQSFPNFIHGFYRFIERHNMFDACQSTMSCHQRICCCGGVSHLTRRFHKTGDRVAHEPQNV